jgi:hypothetical protein
MLITSFGVWPTVTTGNLSGRVTSNFNLAHLNEFGVCTHVPFTQARLTTLNFTLCSPEVSLQFSCHVDDNAGSGNHFPIHFILHMVNTNLSTPVML